MTSLPLTTRGDLVVASRAPQRGEAAAPLVRAGITGTGNSLVLLTWTAADLQRERAAGVRVLRAAGIEAGMRVANTLPGALASPGSLLLGDVIEDCGGLDVPLGTVDNDAAAKAAWELIDRVEANVLILPLNTAERILSAAPGAPQLRPWLKGIVWLRRDAEGVAPPPIAGPLGGNVWQRQWLAAAEVASFVAASCRAEAFHIDAGVEASIVDGQLIVRCAATSLRYATGFRARQVSACACGSGGMVVELS